MPTRRPFNVLFPLREKEAAHSQGSCNSPGLLAAFPTALSASPVLGPQACTERPLPQASLGAEEGGSFLKGRLGGIR